MDKKTVQGSHAKKGRALPLLGLLVSFLLMVLFIGLPPISKAQPGPGYGKQRSFTPPKDERELVSMPDGVKQVLRLDMISHLTSIDQILDHLAEGDLDIAAQAWGRAGSCRLICTTSLSACMRPQATSQKLQRRRVT